MDHALALTTLRQAHACLLADDGLKARLNVVKAQLASLPESASARHLRGEHALLGALLLLRTPQALRLQLEQAGALLDWQRSQVISCAIPLS